MTKLQTMVIIKCDIRNVLINIQQKLINNLSSMYGWVGVWGNRGFFSGGG